MGLLDLVWLVLELDVLGQQALVQVLGQVLVRGPGLSLVLGLVLGIGLLLLCY